MKMLGRILSMVIAAGVSVLAVQYVLRRLHRWHRRVLIVHEDYDYED